MPSPARRTKVFVGYSHKDGVWLEEEWGTYLCYGDPDYRLADGRDAEPRAELEPV